MIRMMCLLDLFWSWGRLRGHRFGYIVVGKFKMLFSEGRRDLLNLHVHLGWGRVGVAGGSINGGEHCVMLHCFREVLCQQVFTKGIWYSIFDVKA